MNILKYLPNTITCCNLLCGSFAIFYIFQNDLLSASLLVGGGLIFDYLDGMVARFTNSYSAFGKELDSLADMVTFGLVPAFIGYSYLKNLGFEYFEFIPFIIIPLSALRLAKFNIDTHQTENFIGVPTPANAIFWASLPILNAWALSEFDELTFNFFTQPFMVMVFSVVLGLLLVSEIPMFSFKFKTLEWKSNKIRFSFLIFTIVLLIILKLAAIPYIILFYILTSIILNLINIKNLRVKVRKKKIKYSDLE